MNEQIVSKEVRDAQVRETVIRWLSESFETGDYRLLNRGGKNRSKDFYIQIRNRTDADLRELQVKVEIYKDGKTYVCDPAGLNQLGMDHAYMFHYGDKGTWMYKDQFEIIYE